MPRSRPDPSWQRARIAACIWLKDRAGRPLTARDRRLARLLSADRGVTDRLIEQAVAICRRRYRLDHRLNPLP